MVSSPSVHHQFVISSSSVHHQVIVSSSSVHHPFIVKLGPKNITQIGLRAEGAKANGQRLIHRSINLTISKFNWSRQLCSQLCSLCSNYSMWSIINNYVPKVNGDIPPSLMVLFIALLGIYFVTLWHYMVLHCMIWYLMLSILHAFAFFASSRGLCLARRLFS